MAGIGEAVGQFIRHNKYFIIIAAILFVALAIIYAGHIYMATGTETFVSKDSQIYKDIDYYNKNFQSTNFLISITSDDVMDPNVLNAMDDLSRQILTNPRIENVTGLNTYVKMGAMHAYGYDRIPENEADIERLLSNTSSNMAQFIVPNRHHTIMTVQLRGDVDEKSEPSILEDVKSIIAWEPLPPGTTAVVTGQTTVSLEVQNDMMSSMMLMLATAVVLMFIALWFTFGHARWRLLPLPIVLVGVLLTGGVMGLAGIPLTMVSMAVFPILIGLGVEYAIQFQNRMMEELGAGKAPGDAVVSTIKNIGPPVFFSMMTATLGFMAILTSPIPMIYDFGLMCMIGIVVCFLTALLLLTSIIYLLASLGGKIKKIEEKPGRIEQVISRVAEATTRHPVTIIIALMLMVGGYALDQRVGVETDTSTFVPQDLPSVVLFRSLNAIVGYKTADLVVEVKAPDLTSQDAIKWADEFARYEQQNNPEVLAVSSIASALAQYNGGVVPTDHASISKALSLMPPDVKKQYIDDFGSTGVIRMTVVSTTTDQQISLLHRVQDDLSFRQPPAGMIAMLGGASQMTLSTFGSLTSDRLTMTAWGGLCVLISLFIVYKGDWVKAVVPVIAVTIVTGLSCIVMFLLQIKYTPLSVTLGALTIGIGIDFSILHMARYYEEKAKGHPPAEAMRIATAKIGNAIFSSASTVIAGFGALAMSNFSILSNFGLVTIIDFVLALTSAFVIMPPLLVAVDTWRMKHLQGQKASA